MRPGGVRTVWRAACVGLLMSAGLVTGWQLRANGGDAPGARPSIVAGDPGCGPKPTCAPSQLAGCLPPCQLCAVAGTFHRDCGACSEVIFCGIDAVCDDDGSCRVVSFTATPLLPPTPSPTPEPCAGDLDGDRHVTIAEIVRAVNASLHGCPPGPATAKAS